MTTLFASANRLGDDGAAAIAEGLSVDTRLERLGLSSNRISGPGTEALARAAASHPRLLLLDLGFVRATPALGELGNRLGDEGAAAIADAFGKPAPTRDGGTAWPSLRALNLEHNGITQVRARLAVRGVWHVALRDWLTC